ARSAWPWSAASSSPSCCCSTSRRFSISTWTRCASSGRACGGPGRCPPAASAPPPTAKSGERQRRGAPRLCRGAAEHSGGGGSHVGPPHSMTKPAVSLVAVAGRPRAPLELGQRLAPEGFTGIYGPSPGDGLSLCEALAPATRAIPLGTSIANIYTRHPFEYSQTAAVVH